MNLFMKKFSEKADLLQTHWFGEMNDSPLPFPIQCRDLSNVHYFLGKAG